MNLSSHVNFLYIKALHIIFVITWFAGLFYLGRLFVYHAEVYEEKKNDSNVFNILNEQFKLMEKRLLFAITWPSCILTLGFGLVASTQFWPWTDFPWLLFKLAMVVLLIIYHLLCHYLFKLFQQNRNHYSSQLMRYLNEVPTILLISIVFLIVLKDSLSTIWAIFGFVIFATVLTIAIWFYKKVRNSPRQK